MSGLMEFYMKDDAASIQIGKNVYRRVSIPIDDFNAACDHYGFVKERTCNFKPFKGPISDDDEIGDRKGVCSECSAYMHEQFNYCPNCGAKVVGE